MEKSLIVIVIVAALIIINPMSIQLSDIINVIVNFLGDMFVFAFTTIIKILEFTLQLVV